MVVEQTFPQIGFVGVQDTRLLPYRLGSTTLSFLYFCLVIFMTEIHRPRLLSGYIVLDTLNPDTKQCCHEPAGLLYTCTLNYTNNMEKYNMQINIHRVFLV